MDGRATIRPEGTGGILLWATRITVWELIVRPPTTPSGGGQYRLPHRPYHSIRDHEGRQDTKSQWEENKGMEM